MDDREILRDRQVEIVQRWIAREEPRRLVSAAARLRRREAVRMLPLAEGIAGVSLARVAGEGDARVRVAVGAGQVGGADAGNREVDRVGPAARPAIDARQLPVVRDETEPFVLGCPRRLVDRLDSDVMRPIVVQQGVIEMSRLLRGEIRHARGKIGAVDPLGLAPHPEAGQHESALEPAAD